MYLAKILRNSSENNMTIKFKKSEMDVRQITNFDYFFQNEKLTIYEEIIVAAKKNYN